MNGHPIITSLIVLAAWLLPLGTLDAQVAEMGFQLSDGCGSTIELVAGKTHQIRGFTTFESFEPGGQGWTQVVEIFSDDIGDTVCLGVSSTEACDNSCKEILIGEPILRLIDGTAFVSQIPSGICDPGSAVDPQPNRVGFVDATFMKIGNRLPVGFYRTLPFTVLVHVPAAFGEMNKPPDIVVRMEYSGDLRGGGQLQHTTVSWDGNSLRGPHENVILTSCELTIRAVAGGSLHADSNLDGNVDVFDAIAFLRQLFLGNNGPCEGAFNGPDNLAINDSDGSGTNDISDAIYLLTWVILGGPEPVGGFECRDDLPNCQNSCRL